MNKEVSKKEALDSLASIKQTNEVSKKNFTGSRILFFTTALSVIAVFASQILKDSHTLWQEYNGYLYLVMFAALGLQHFVNKINGFKSRFYPRTKFGKQLFWLVAMSSVLLIYGGRFLANEGYFTLTYLLIITFSGILIYLSLKYPLMDIVETEKTQ